MENRNGLCVDLAVCSAIQTETEAAKQLLARQARKRVRPASLGADKGYHTKDFVAHLRKRKIAPHIAQIEGRRTPGWMRAQRVMQVTQKPAQAQTRRGDLRPTEGLRRIAPHARAQSCSGADARLHRGGGLQPVAHESARSGHRVDLSGESENGPLASRIGGNNGKSKQQERSSAPSKQFNEIEGRHFRGFCIRLLVSSL